MIEAIVIIYAVIAGAAAAATSILMRGRNWSVLASVGAGILWPLLLWAVLWDGAPGGGRKGCK